MSTQKRRYTKGEPTADVLEVLCATSLPTNSDGEMSLPNTDSRYQKQDKEELPLAFIVVFSGGTEREKDYLSLLQSHKNFPTLRLEFMANEYFLEKGEPAIFSFAFQQQQKYKESASTEIPDQYFLLTDVDDFGEWVTKKIPECNENQIKVLVSNPCFEVWLYYATKEDAFLGFSMPDNPKQLSQTVKTWCGKAVKGGLQPKKYLYCLEENIINAKKNYHYNPETLYGELFSTNVYEFGEAILSFIKDKLIENKTLQAEKRRKFFKGKQ